MYIGSENQFRNLYVVNSTVKTAMSADLNTDGNIMMSEDANGDVYFKYKDGANVLTSDIIKKDNVKSIVFKKGVSRTLKQFKVTIDGTPIVGQDYILNVTIRNYVALGDDSTLVKFGAVHATSKIKDASTFYIEMAKSLARSFMREAAPLVDIWLDGTNQASVLEDGIYKAPDKSKTYTGIIIKESSQISSWRRGVAPMSPTKFEVTCGTILKDGEDTVWGTTSEKPEAATVGTVKEIKNGRNYADMEWFYHGVRADMYHEATYPDNFEFTPKITSLDINYNAVDIHFYYEGAGVDAAKSEKTITIVGSALDGSTTSGNFVKVIADKLGLTAISV